MTTSWIQLMLGTELAAPNLPDERHLWLKVILIASLVAVGLLAWLVMRNKLFGRLFFILQFVLGIVFVIWPDLTTRLGNLIGIGRGTDFLLYLLIIFVYFSEMCILAKFRQIERRQTLMIRQMALRDATRLGKGSPTP
ncbi:MAG: DUF2304 domain-containing protein [Victivallales bacterium]|nr:DUF2304 domain-containing protein [Victivallales bacterium]